MQKQGNGFCSEPNIDGLFTGGYVTNNEPNFVFICELSASRRVPDLNIQSTIIHEFTHNYQKDISDANIKYGKNVIGGSNDVLKNYYDIIFDVKDDYWEIDNKIVNEKAILNPCRLYGEGIGFSSTEGNIFVSRYQCQTSLRIEELTPLPMHLMPEEEMAETAMVFYLNPLLLKNQDMYDYESEGTKYTGNLKRFEYFNLHFNKYE